MYACMYVRVLSVFGVTVFGVKYGCLNGVCKLSVKYVKLSVNFSNLVVRLLFRILLPRTTTSGKRHSISICLFLFFLQILLFEPTVKLEKQ